MSASLAAFDRPRIAASNTVFKSGPLFISSKGLGWKSWKKRWFILTRTSLVFFKNDPMSKSTAASIDCERNPREDESTQSQPAQSQSQPAQSQPTQVSTNMDVEKGSTHSDDVDKKENDKKRPRKEVESRSPYWDHFDKFVCPVENVKKGKCKYCFKVIKADPTKHGTRPLKNHYESCKKKPQVVETSQTRVAFQPRVGDKEAPLVSWKFDQTKARDALGHWLVVDELPFKTVENKGFKSFMSVLCPMFTVPSRRTITRDIYNLYIDEKKKLKDFIKNHSQRVCITTDTWISIQRVNYMCLTAHFIDDDWKLQKRILNFCPISGHKSEEVGKGVEKCLLDWNIDKVFSITVDNASSNDGAVVYLLKKFENWGTNVLGGKYVHIRCIAHIVNLIVQDGLKNKDEHRAISRIRGAVRYVKSSPARYKRFLECVDMEKLDTNKLLSLDVPTRWNSTYLMLESATCLRRAFDSYHDLDLGYAIDLSKQPYDGIPTDYDWERAELLLKFLAHFYKLTLCISGSLYVTSNNVFHEISGVEMLLKSWLESDDFELSQMSIRMKEKFDKYWGSMEKMNMIFYYAVILDPRRKYMFLEFSFDSIYGVYEIEKSMMMKHNVKNGMQELFEYYKLRYGSKSNERSEATSSSSSSSKATMDSSTMPFRDLIDGFNRYKCGGKGQNLKSELEKYLNEDCEDEWDNFDLLNWWKVNSQRFSILSKVARDILAVPVSTVASESAFSTGGRVLDAFRSSLSPKIVQALICAQDWLRLDPTPICMEEDLSEVDLLDKELTKLGVDSTIIDV